MEAGAAAVWQCWRSKPTLFNSGYPTESFVLLYSAMNSFHETVGAKGDAAINSRDLAFRAGVTHGHAVDFLTCISSSGLGTEERKQP